MPELAIRPYEDTDEPAVLALLAASLGKVADERYRGFFRWKHLENPFGRSFMWVAEVDGRVTGFRAFLRWRFVDPGGEPVEAVRAVDTATHPDVRGMGIFSALTRHGLEEMRPAGIDFVFNTPNDQSRPGYLKMGWQIEGRVPVQVRPRSLLSLTRVLRASTAASPWSRDSDLGDSVDEHRLATLVAGAANRSSGVLSTQRSPAFLAWRYGGCAAVSSRLVAADQGAVLVRFRDRGPAIEATVCDVVGEVRPGAAGAAVRHAMRAARADYALASARNRVGGMLAVSRLGPIQTRRPVAKEPNRLPLALTLGDVELF